MPNEVNNECEKKLKKKNVNLLLTLAIFVGICTVLVAAEQQKVVIPSASGTKPINNGTIHELLKNPNYPGYITVKYSGEKAVSISSKNETSFDFEIEYICTNNKTTKHEVTIDPSNKWSSRISQGLGDGKGSICFNDYVKWEVEGNIVLESNKPVILTMTLTIPKELPKIEIPFKPIGIVADIPIQYHIGELRLVD